MFSRLKLWLLIPFAFLAFRVSAQTTVTFKIDANDFIAGGGVMANNVVSIAGSFSSRGGTLPDWTPQAGAMTSQGNNVWTKTIVFSGGLVGMDSLLWKYVQGSAWADGDEGNDWFDSSPDCKKPGENYNRKWLIPTSGTWLVSSKWGLCPTIEAVGPPELTTAALTSITQTTALTGGTITSGGGSTVSARGVCWSTSPNPTIALTTKTSNGTGTGTFASPLTGLTLNTTYYVRAYATNETTTAYGNELMFTTLPDAATLPVLSTNATSGINQNSAVSGGNITSEGSSAVIARGVCWGTSPNPTIALSTKTVDGSGAGSFTSNITGLTLNTTYFVRAYATNASGTSYGNQRNFTTEIPPATVPVLTTLPVTLVTQTGAASGGDITNNGGSPVTEKGICWSTSPNPTIALATKTTQGGGFGVFESPITGLTPGTLYYLRGYATNVAGTGYGNQISFSTVGVGDSTVVTFKVDLTDFLAGGGTINQIVSIAGSFTDRGGNLPNWTPASGGMTNLGNNIWSKTVTFKGSTVTTDSLYWKYVQGSAWADGDEGNEWIDLTPDCKQTVDVNRKIMLPGNGRWVLSSKWAQCPTLSPATGEPELTTSEVIGITQTGGITGGNITYGGSAPVTARGVCWSSTQNPTVALATKTVDGSGAGPFSSTITGLAPNTLYYVRAYATNSVGTAYGNPRSFTTSPVVTNDSTVVTFKVDVTDFLAGGGTFNQIASIAGNFTDRGGNLPNWTPASGAMTNLGNNLWSKTVTFKGASVTTDSLYWKYVQGADWPDGDEGNDWGADTTNLCKKTGDNNNRKIKLPTSGNWVVSSKWGKCATISGALVGEPQLSTSAVTGITETGASSGGNIANAGNTPVTARGVCWSTTPNPTVALSTKTSDGTGAGTFSSTLTGLTLNTTYYVRAYATNGSGTAYGNEITFTTLGQTAVVPVLTTTAVTGITQTGSVSGGNVTSNGGSPVTARGVCWSTTQDPTVALTTKTSDGTGDGAFVSTLTGLAPGTLYYLRAYATNSVGTAYGNPLSFTTSAVATNDSTVVTFKVDVTDFLAGGGTLNQIASIAGSFTDRGGNLPNWDPTAGAMTNLGNNVWSKKVTFKGPAVTTDSLYWKYVQGSAWADGDEGNDWGTDVSNQCKKPGDNNNRKIKLPVSGNWVVSSKWGQCPTVTPATGEPELSTVAVTGITQNGAISGGNITSGGTSPVTARGVCWSTTVNPTVALSTKTSDGTGAGTFSSTLTGLTLNTTYYVRTYATNGSGTAYGNEISFTTLGQTAVVPALTTTEITGITQTGSISGGNITSNGGAPVTARGVCWSTTQDPTVALPTKTSDGTGDGSFVSTITGLAPATLYYVRAYATNSVGTAYGNALSFTTSPVPSNDSTIIAFTVDVNDFLAGGGTFNQIASIAGSFTDRGGNLPNWTPAAGPMTNLGNNIWSRTVTFKGTTVTTDSLFWKYVQGSDWADGDEGNDWGTDVSNQCKKPGDNNNRKILLPSSGSWVVFSKWGQCATLISEVKSIIASDDNLEVFPNPTSNSLNIRFKDQSKAQSLRLVSGDGREVIQMDLSKSEGLEQVLDVSSIPSGIYKLMVLGKNSISGKSISIVK